MKSLRLHFLTLSLLLIATLTVKAEKIWTNVVSGFWQDGTNWTGHTAPDITAFIQITNDNTKTITINGLTPTSELTVQMLTLSAPPGATNTLLLQEVGTNNPVTFQTGLELQDGAALRITNSAVLLQLTNDHVNIDGRMTLDSGFIDFGDITVTARVGRVTSGLLTINSGWVSAGTLTVGGLTNSSGTLSMNGGSLLVSSLMSVGRNPSTTGTCWLLGGQLIVPNDDTRVGDEGIGIMVISNATATLTNLQVGRDALSAGTLTLQQGSLVSVQSDIPLARFNGSTGAVNVAGGQLLADGFALYVGRGGDGQLSLSNGLVHATRVLVAADTTNSVGSTGLLTVTGGSLLASSNLLVGSAGYATGQATLSGGILSVSNSAGTGVSIVSSGEITLNGGTLVTDNLVLTNAGGQLTFNSGTLESRGTIIANGSPFVIGDGTNTAVFHLNGGTHTFAGGLVISSNATLTGCATIVGNIINHGTISTNCSGTLVAPVIVSQPVGQTLDAGGTLNLSVTASGTGPLAYQWQLSGADLTGATTSAYTKTNAQAADSGPYTVLITNAGGAVTSAVASVTVLMPPSITTPPQSTTASIAGSASFSVIASGTQPLAYQWQFDGTNLAGATASSLTLTNIQPVDAGSYTVVVTNLAGSVTSSPALLQVQSLIALKITFVERSGSTNTVSVQSNVGATYTLQFKDSLVETNWTAVLPPALGTGGTLRLQDSAATGPVRFYRVLSQ